MLRRDDEALPLLSARSDASTSALSTASTAATYNGHGRVGISVAKVTPCSSSTKSYRAPPSPFETGFPMVFTSPIPSPRPHRLSFAYEKHEHHRDLHVFFTLLMSVVGAGMLSVPYTFLLVPTWEAVLAIIGVGVAMALTSTALLYAHVQLAKEEEAVMHIGAGRRFNSFQSIAIVAGGDLFGYLVSVVTAVGIYGGCVGCIRIVKDIAPFMVSVLYTLGGGDAHALAATTGQYVANYLLWGAFLLVVFPLCLLRNLSGLRVSSYLGFAFSLYLVAAIIYRFYHQLDVENHATPAPALDSNNSLPVMTAPAIVDTLAPPASLATAVVGSSFSRLSQSVSIYNYAFMMQLNLIPLFIELRGSFADPLRTSQRKMTRCIFAVSAFCIALYAAFGIFAAKLYGDTIRGNILLNLENDPVMEIPLVAVFLTVVLSFPLLFHPLRGVIEELIFTTSLLPELPFSTRLGTTSVLLLSQLFLAIWVPGIQVVFALTGATSCLLICFVFPTMLFLRLYPWRKHGRRGSLAMLTLCAIVAFFTVVGLQATWFLLIDIYRH
ncbi:hypothetical protein Poli38472_013541 [Pythium oligandrum]|uniref:Amino acid transporter transmembrane domain-containing protein n=1 Tax=Pythium oligandrum TaxID=41045 RepID=A0A8K1FFW2_PYTOL|nr:hypothetical protein Poli38472_013541 [Pythium oligandrum]|eukprot:TMW58067.1 hypothetical protein Poli38472_013541 [Pythium oligandrum]